jgi:hypothetical protein
LTGRFTLIAATNQRSDANSRRTQLAATNGSSVDFIDDFGYNDLHRLTQFTRSGVLGRSAAAEKRGNLGCSAAGWFFSPTR